MRRHSWDGELRSAASVNHVINRGSARRGVFLKDGDWQPFLKAIAHACLKALRFDTEISRGRGIRRESAGPARYCQEEASRPNYVNGGPAKRPTNLLDKVTMI
jgi:hypothetical protein